MTCTAAATLTRIRQFPGCAALSLLTAIALPACAQQPEARRAETEKVLRVGVSVGQMAAVNPASGLKQIAQNQSIESLARIGDDGRPQPLVASGWTLTDDRSTLDVTLRSGIKFSDGTPVTAAMVKTQLDAMLPRAMGPAFQDFDSVTPIGESALRLRFRRPSPFLLEVLEAQVAKPTDRSIGTGPFRIAGPSAPNDLLANEYYYLGRPVIDRLVVTPYPTVRAAWADLLRNRIDLLYEVGVDALNSLEGGRSVSIFKFTRRYQYELLFNTRKGPVMATDLRRAMSAAIDREQLVTVALDGNGTASNGAVWPGHWALQSGSVSSLYEPGQAAKQNQRIRFTCLVPPDYERIGLAVKQQLEQINVDMTLEERTPDDIFKALASGEFDAALMDVISGASIFRIYEWWHTGGAMNPGSLGNERADRALDAARFARTDAEYQQAILALQSFFRQDPPALFLAWSQRARAVNTRFEVPQPEPNRDILSSLRLWRETTGIATASRN